MQSHVPQTHFNNTKNMQKMSQLWSQSPAMAPQPDLSGRRSADTNPNTNIAVPTNECLTNEFTNSSSTHLSFNGSSGP